MVEVVDPRELALPDVGPVVLIDPETGHRCEVWTSSPRIRDQYAELAAAHRTAVAAAVRASGAEHLVLRTDRDWVLDLARFVRRSASSPLPTRSSMTFLSPWWLLLLVPIALMAAAYVVQQSRRSKYAVRFASLPMLERLIPRRPGWRRHLPAIASLFGFVLLAFAVARPEMEVRVPRENATVIVAVDVSNSMQATDIEPNRIKAASEAATKFVDALPQGFNVGVVTFSGTTDVRAAPTDDREIAMSALKGLTLGPRTAIGEGVFTSLDQIEAVASQAKKKKVPGLVVLLSDGTNTFGRSPEEAGAAAHEAGVPVSTIAYGTPTGTVEIDGQLIPVPVDKETLADLAQSTNGRSYTAESSDELNQVYDDIQSQIGYRTEPREVTQWAAGLGLLFGLLAAALSLRWFSRLP